MQESKTTHPCCGAWLGMQHMETCPERWAASAGRGYGKIVTIEIPQTTPDNPIRLLQDAMLFIRRRHNYGPKRRAEERMKLLKRFTPMEAHINREHWGYIANGRD